MRVLIADDSALIRQFLARVLRGASGIEVVGQAGTGEEAVEKVLELRPDVVTMDVEMPGLGGIEAVRRIMEVRPTPILMISTLTQAGSRTTMEALAAGAMDFMAKSTDLMELDTIAQTVVEKVSQLGARGTRLLRPRPKAPSPRPAAAQGPSSRPPLVIIGASTGGPRALFQVLPWLPQGLGAAVVVVQHMPPGFTRSLAERMDREAPLPVREAADGDGIRAGEVLIAPAGRHLALLGTRVRLTLDPPMHGVRPAVDVALQSAAATYRGPLVAVILTGMGRDGTEGARSVRSRGGRVIAESSRTALIYGMPASVVEAGLADQVSDLDEVADAIVAQCEDLNHAS